MNLSDLRTIESSDGDSKRDRIIDQFEQQWLNESSPPNIVEFCRYCVENERELIEADERSLPSITLALALVDLEFRWRYDSKARPKGTAWYYQQLHPFGLDEARMLILASNELVVRSRWGDRPIVKDLAAAQLPDASEDDVKSLEEQLRVELESRFPIACNVYTKSIHRFRADLKTPCIIGRQRSSDPKNQETHMCPRDNILRYVVAQQHENSISRKQLRIERISVSDLCITSLSTNVSTYWESTELKVGQTTRITLPANGTVLRFGGFFMHLQQV